MTSYESMAAQLATIASLNGFPSMYPGSEKIINYIFMRKMFLKYFVLFLHFFSFHPVTMKAFYTINLSNKCNRLKLNRWHRLAVQAQNHHQVPLNQQRNNHWTLVQSLLMHQCLINMIRSRCTGEWFCF